MANLLQSSQHALPSMCTSQARVYLERTVPELFGRALTASKLWTTVEDDHYYDVYQVSAPDGRRTERFYFDVTPFFERGVEWNYDAWLDLPDTARTYPVWLFFGESELQTIAAFGGPGAYAELCRLGVSFRHASSDECGQRIASHTRADTHRLHVHALRSYATQSIPFLHGFPFYRLFMHHQLVHMAQGHAIESSEVGFEAQCEAPVPGRDCIKFRPLPSFDLANDFLNFVLWTHEPHAFDCAAELAAFGETARYGVRAELFTTRELRVALGNAHLEGDLKQRLRNAIGVDAPAARREAPSQRVAH